MLQAAVDEFLSSTPEQPKIWSWRRPTLCRRSHHRARVVWRQCAAPSRSRSASSTLTHCGGGAVDCKTPARNETSLRIRRSGGRSTMKWNESGKQSRGTSRKWARSGLTWACDMVRRGKALAVTGDTVIRRALSGGDMGPLARLDYAAADAAVGALAVNDRCTLADVVGRALASPAKLRSQLRRVALVKAAVSLWPLTRAAVAQTLTAGDGRWTSELQFSLICFFDILLLPRHTDHERRQAVQLLTSFLSAVRSNRAQRAWMAADMLALHFPARLSVPALIQITRTARLACGRYYALDGLARLLEARRNRLLLPRVRAAIHDLADRDGSQAVARLARRFVQEWPQTNEDSRG